jgi:cytosine/adenosine deaminase-related metal-dependent hydrolase
MDERLGDLESGEILVEGARIRDVAHRIEVSDCETLDARGMIALPGFVDTHRHTWQTQLRNVAAEWTLFDYFVEMRLCYSSVYTAEDAYLGNYAGAVEALDAGVTTLVDHSHIMNTPEHADAAIDGLEHAGIRGIFCYGLFANPVRESGKPVEYPGLESPEWHFQDCKRIRKERLASDDGLVRLGVATNELESLPIAAAAREIEFARSIGAARISAHIAMGALSRGRALVSRLAERGLLGPDLLFVHGAELSDREIDALVDAEASVSVTPETEVQMGMGTPVTGRILARGGKLGLGIDIVSNYSGDMFAQMRMGLQIERFRRNLDLDVAGLAPRRLAFSCRDVLRLATIGGAEAIGLGDRVGSLVPGKQADLVLLRTDTTAMMPVNDAAAAVVLSASPRDVDTVVVAGRILKRAGRLVGVDLARLGRELSASRDRIVGQFAQIDTRELRGLVGPLFPLAAE